MLAGSGGLRCFLSGASPEDTRGLRTDPGLVPGRLLSLLDGSQDQVRPRGV